MALIDIPAGVTRSHLNTLLSRGNPFHVSGEALVYCLHGAEKRSNADHFECDLAIAHPHLCPCCESFYAKPSDEPGPCPTCSVPSLLIGGKT